MTRVIRCTRAEGPDYLELRDESIREPGRGELRIRMQAAGLNRSELLFMHGKYLSQPVLPSRIGAEGAGIVTGVGEGVVGISEGDAVCIFPSFSFSEYGVLAEEVILPASAVVPKPASLSFSEAAAVGVSYPSVYGGLIQAGKLKAGETAVIVAASSGLGLAAVEFAAAQGARVIATSRTHDKDAIILEAGAEQVIATDEDDFVARIQEITDGQGFDLALDSLSGPFVEKLVEAAGHEARIVEFGALSMAPASFPPFPVIAKGISLIGFHVIHNLYEYPDRCRTAMDYVLARLADGRLKPRIDREFSLEDTADAYRYLASNAQEGKIIVRMD